MTVLTLRAADHNWRSRGLCATSIDDDFWYPSMKADNDTARQQIEDAKGVCHVCPVLTQCQTAIEAAEGNCGENYRFGIVAGMTPRERHRAYLRRKAMSDARAAA